jgi:hypothetical protein
LTRQQKNGLAGIAPHQPHTHRKDAMSNLIVLQNTDDSQPPLTHTRTMTEEQFYGRIANNGKVRIEHRPGEILVYRNGTRVARWLPYPQVLQYIPNSQDAAPDAKPDEDEAIITPPSCPVCGKEMELYRQFDGCSFFWGCHGYWGPRKCGGTVDVQPGTLAELEALNVYLIQTHAQQLAEGRRRRRSRIFA